ncbi:MAG: hypothetical protein OEV00_09825 [Acidobacteriota bacterium]|nr:hypothetical protein [Acidobacteriota bacterium]MDH3785609.1 hypothetical protein [Acidobacteriota bacterium]
MRVSIPRVLSVALLLLPVIVLAGPKKSEAGVGAYEALGIKTGKVLTGTVLRARVVPNATDKQVVSIVTYLTGRNSKSDAVNVRFGVFQAAGERLVAIHTADLGEIAGGHVGAGDLQLLDLDQDGTNEVIVFYDDFSDELITQRQAVVYFHEDGAFVPRWQGPVEYDATRKVRDLADERRDRFVREIDLANTMRTRGVTLFFDKRVTAIAGETLAQPKTVQETFPLRPKPQR